MPLIIRPHSATYKAPASVTATIGGVSGVKVGANRPAATATILGQLDELTTREARERYGIEEDRAGVWMCNISDGNSVVLEGSLTVDSVVWIVKGKKRISHGLPLDHWEMLVVRANG